MVKDVQTVKLTPEQIDRYDAKRSSQDLGKLCHAPSKSMRFNPGGKVLPCSQNTIYELGTYPSSSLMEIWEGEKKRALDQTLQRYCLAPGCNECARDIEDGNMEAVRSKIYDNLPRNLRYPVMLDFKLDSVCDLACVMCSSYSSTRHRRQRTHEGLHRRHPYDRRFVEEVSGFIPYLREARFTGGEPFLISIYTDIWEEMARLNPGCTIWIQTSGCHIDGKARQLIQRSRMSFNFSIDSLVPTRYESIRRGSRFRKMQENFEYLLKRTRRTGTEITVNTCVMRENWMEIPDIVHFCNRLDIRIGFCIVWFPASHAIWTLPAEDIARVLERYREIQLPDDTPARSENRRRFRELTGVIDSFVGAAHCRNQPGTSQTMTSEEIHRTLEQGCSVMGLTGRENRAIRRTLSKRIEQLISDPLIDAVFIEYMTAALGLFSADILVDTLLNEPLSRLSEDIRAFGDRPVL